MDDIGKLTVIAAIMGALLVAGLIIGAPEKAPEVAPPEPAVVQEVTIVPQETLELLDPVYSEKAIFQDRTIRIAFNASYGEEGIESRLPFWLHNVSPDVINVLWDRCSIQLPSGNTVAILNEQSTQHFVPPSSMISIAPAGDLFDAVIPVTEIEWYDEGWSITSGVLDAGAFTLVLAIERNGGCLDLDAPERCAQHGHLAEDCDGVSDPACNRREIVHYTFRFIVR